MRLEHQDRYWTGLENCPDQPADDQFEPIPLKDLKSAKDLAKFCAAADLVDKIPERKSVWVENFKAVAAALIQTEKAPRPVLFAKQTASDGSPVLFFAWEMNASPERTKR